MVTGKRPRDSSDKENWDIIFKNLVQILGKKDDQLESLFKRWKILEDGIKKQHERWVSDVYDYKLQLSLMKKENETLEMMRLVEIASFNLLLGLKERDCFHCKEKLEHLQKDLDDFKAWFDIFTLNTNENCDSEDADCKSLEDKIRKQKIEFEELAFEKRSEFTTLLQESGFAWSQFKRIESGFTDKLMRKDKEIEQLKSSNHEKDKIISRLKAEEMEDNASNKDEEISKHSTEVKPLRRSPRLNRC